MCKRLRAVLPFLCFSLLFAAPAQAQAPAAPTGFSVDTDNGAAEAEWTAVSGATDYWLELQVGLTGTTTSLQPGSHVTSVDFKIAPNATNCCVKNESYRTRIKVTVSGSDSSWTDWHHFIYTGDSTITTSLTDLTLTLSLAYNYTSGLLFMETSANKNATLQCAINDGTAFSCINGTNSVSQPANATYSVVATATAGVQTARAEAVLVVPASPGPAVEVNTPTGFSIAASTGIASWTAASSATGYRLELQVGETGATTTLIPGNVTSVNFTSAANATNCCVNGESYRSRIQTIYNDANSPWSSWTSFTYTGTTSIPDPPTGFSVDTNNGAAEAEWTAVSGATDYFLELQVGTTGTTTSLQPGSHVTSVDFKVAPNATNCCVNGQTYRSRIKVATSGGHSAWSSSWTSFTYSGTSTISAPPPPPDPVNLNLDLPSDISNPLPDSPPSGIETPTPQPIPTQDHSQLPAGAKIESDSPWIAFREVSGAAIGDPSVRDVAMSAIDVWGPLGVNAEVCFDQPGSLILLDAAYSPRRPVWLTAYQRADGKTCAQLDRAGTVVLMPARLSPEATSTPTPAVAAPNRFVIADSIDDMITLDNCMVAAGELLNFRERPAGRVLGLYIGGSQALARTANWFKVRYLGKEGWISALYVTPSGDCG